MFHPIIIKLYLVRDQLYYLEKALEKYTEEDEWHAGVYDEILIITDRFYRVRDRAIKLFGSTDAVERHLSAFGHLGGDA